MRMTPSVGTGTVLPRAETVKGKKQKSFCTSNQPAAPLPRPVPFTLKIIRPARPDGGAHVTSQILISGADAIEPDAYSYLLAQLIPGEAYEVILDNEVVARQNGSGWGGRARCTITVQAVSTPELLKGVCILQALPPRQPFDLLCVPITPQPPTRCFISTPEACVRI